MTSSIGVCETAIVLCKSVRCTAAPRVANRNINGGYRCSCAARRYERSKDAGQAGDSRLMTPSTRMDLVSM